MKNLQTPCSLAELETIWEEDDAPVPVEQETIRRYAPSKTLKGVSLALLFVIGWALVFAVAIVIMKAITHPAI